MQPGLYNSENGLQLTFSFFTFDVEPASRNKPCKRAKTAISQQAAA